MSPSTDRGQNIRALFSMGPAIQRMARDPYHRKDVRLIVAQLARLTIQDANRTLS